MEWKYLTNAVGNLSNLGTKFIGFFMLVALTLPAQTEKAGFPTTDAEKMADALRAGPIFITQSATILDWPATPGGEYRVLRKGTTDWTCLPGVPLYSHDEPMCLDRTSLQWIKDSLADRPVHIDQIGVMYMYTGAWVPNLQGTSHSKDHTYHVGPHVMIVTPHNEDLAKFNRDGSNGQIYVAHLPGHSELYLIMPFQDLSQE